ncbi:MAG: hypothetical protein L7W43_17585 [Rubripirellula sp.]|nr:hypothetical protein [Rubripirellula sp.]
MTIPCPDAAFEQVKTTDDRVGDCVSRTSQRDWSQIVSFRFLETGGVDLVDFHYDSGLG